MPRLSTVDNQKIAELGATIAQRSDGTRQILPHLLPPLQELLGAEKTLAYGVEASDVSARLAFLVGARPYPRMRELAAEWFATRTSRATAYDLVAPQKWQRNVPLLSHDVVAGTHPMVTELFPRVGLAGHDQVRVLVCAGAQLLAWVGGFRPEKFGKRELRVLGRLVPALQRRLRLEEMLADAQLNSLALTAALDAIGAAAFIVTAMGSVKHANRAGGELLVHKGRALRAELEACVGRAPRSPRFAVTRLFADGMREHFFVVERPARGDVRPRAAAAARAWQLTPRQAEVLLLLARGESNKAIAAQLRCTERTVEVHVSAILHRADVESRAALAALVWSRAP
jgi:DNA-binding CsgD family transcriptional regulator